jgi:hypothetical protein
MTKKKRGLGYEWSDARLADRDHVFASLRRIYPRGAAWRWMEVPHEAFGGKSAYSLILSGRTGEVLAEVDRLATGAYV